MAEHGIAQQSEAHNNPEHIQEFWKERAVEERAEARRTSLRDCIDYEMTPIERGINFLFEIQNTDTSLMFRALFNQMRARLYEIEDAITRDIGPVNILDKWNNLNPSEASTILGAELKK